MSARESKCESESVCVSVALPGLRVTLPGLHCIAHLRCVYCTCAVCVLQGMQGMQECDLRAIARLYQRQLSCAE